MTIWVCLTCGIEYPDTATPPGECRICVDERQWVPATGQQWTTPSDLITSGHQVRVTPIEPSLFAVTVTPTLGIGQRGLYLQTEAGGLLWEPPGFVDAGGIRALQDLGGVAVISASHPHLTGASIQWSHAFDRAPVLVAAADRDWICRPDSVIELWSGRREVLPNVVFQQCGGHFAGSSVVHWKTGAHGRGALLTGDTILPGADLKSVSAMRSYPNRIPLPERSISRILQALEPYAYDRIHSAFSTIDSGAKEIVQSSLSRYLAWIRGDHIDE